MASSPVINPTPAGTTVNGTFYPNLGNSDSAFPSNQNPAAQPAPKVVVTAGPAQAKFNQNSSDLSTLLAGLNQPNNQTKDTTATLDNTNDSYTQLLDKLSARSDAGTQALISSIQAQRSQNGAKIENEAKNYESGLQLLGIQKNEAQSTPDLLAGQIKNQEDVAQQKLQALDVETNKAIMDAQTAQSNNDLKTLQDKMAYIKQLNTQKQDALKAEADRLTSSATIASDVIAGVYDQLQKLSPADQLAYLHKAADTYGIPYGSFVAAVAKQQYTQQDQALTLAEKEKILSGGGADKILTPSEAASYVKNSPLVDISAGDSVGDANAAVAAANTFTKSLNAFVADPNNLDENGNLNPADFQATLAGIPAGLNRTAILQALAPYVDTSTGIFSGQSKAQLEAKYGITAADLKILKGQ